MEKPINGNMIYTLNTPRVRFSQIQDMEVEFKRLEYNTCARCRNANTFNMSYFFDGDLVECTVSGQFVNPTQKGMVCFRKK